MEIPTIVIKIIFHSIFTIPGEAVLINAMKALELVNEWSITNDWLVEKFIYMKD